MSAPDNTQTLAPNATIAALSTPPMFPEIPESCKHLLSTPAPKFAEKDKARLNCNDFIIEACKIHDLKTLRKLLENNEADVDPTYCDSAAWKHAVLGKHREMCELLIEHFGPAFFYDDQTLRDACASDNREIAMFILSLIEEDITKMGLPCVDDEAVQMASRRGNQQFVMRVLDGWIPNDFVDLTWMCISAMTGCVYGNNVMLFDLVMDKYKTHVATSSEEEREFALIPHSTLINRYLLLVIANTRKYKFFIRALNELDVSINDPLVDDCYTVLNKTSGYGLNPGAGMALFMACCGAKDSRLIDALINKCGINLLMNTKKSLSTMTKLFKPACTNNHASAVKLIIEHADTDTALPLFKICADHSKSDLGAVIITAHGSQLVNQIEADPELTQNPIVRGLLRKYFMSKYELYR